MSEKGYKKVSELVYVLFVESIIFASVSITLIGQRMNVFDWPETRTWPVLGTTIQILLTYTLFVLLLVCFIHINRFDDYVIEGSQACIKSVGRIITVTAMFTLTTCTLVWFYDRVDWALILCQLWGTSCATSSDPSYVFWSWTYNVYLAILLPLFIVQAGLQMTMASFLKNQFSNTFAPRRIITVNCAFVLTLQATHTVDQNFVLGCSDSCQIINNSTVFNESPGDVVVTSSPIVLACGFFFVMDIIADVCCGFLSDAKNVPAFIIFIVVRCLEIMLNPIFLFLFSVPVPETISWTYFGVTCILAILDIVDVIIKYMKHKDLKTANQPSSNSIDQKSSNLLQIKSNSAFTIEPARRRRFMLTYAGIGGPVSTTTPKDALYSKTKRLHKKQV